MRITRTAALAAFAALAASGAMAGPIAQACMASERGSGNRAVCGCIQSVANLTLNGNDQRLAAQFFAEPQKAQDVRMSKSDHHNAFWDRYKQFGATAAATCS
ncbi:MAG: hypothetical protein ACU0DK_12820 [Pseudooceanicola sp.]